MMSFDLEDRPNNALIEDSEFWVRWDTWFFRLYEFVKDRVRGETTGDENATLGSGETYHGVTSLSAPRTVTLAGVGDLRDGQQVVIQDESGLAGTHTITVSPVTGVSTITTNHGRLTVYKSGSTYFGA